MRYCVTALCPRVLYLPNSLGDRKLLAEFRRRRGSATLEQNMRELPLENLLVRRSHGPARQLIQSDLPASADFACDRVPVRLPEPRFAPSDLASDPSRTLECGSLIDRRHALVAAGRGA
jgi:hypothetical protein